MQALNGAMSALVSGVAGIFLLAGAMMLFGRVAKLMETPAHEQVSRADKHLPLQGRWLGYLLSIVLLPLAFLAILVGGGLLFGTFLALLALLSGAH